MSISNLPAASESTWIDRAVKVTLALAALMFIGFVVAVVLARLRYPYELEWMTGSILDHVERVQHGLPLYAEPTADWIPFLYPPLYYWVAALVSHGFVGARLISIAATVVQAWAVWRLADIGGATRLWRLVAVGLFCAAFAFVGYWYDIERCDSLFMALVTVAAVVACGPASLLRNAIAGLLLGTAVLAKQPAVVFIGAAALAVAYTRGVRAGLILLGCAAAVAVPATLWLHVSTHGWYSYYVFKMPVAHGIVSDAAAVFFLQDLPRGWLLLVVTLFAAYECATRAWRRSRSEPERIIAWLFLLGGFIAAASSRMHAGGWNNVLMFWVPFAVCEIAVVASQLRGSVRARAAAGALVLVQFLGFAYDPTDVIPSGTRAHYVDHIRELEATRGEVLVPGEGHLTAHRHYHHSALYDVLRTENHVPPTLADNLRTRKYGAIVLYWLEDLFPPPVAGGEFYRLVMSNYCFAERIDGGLPFPVVGTHVRPTWVLVPRATPLPDDLPTLQRQQAAELAAVDIPRGKPDKVECPKLE